MCNHADLMAGLLRASGEAVRVNICPADVARQILMCQVDDPHGFTFQVVSCQLLVVSCWWLVYGSYFCNGSATPMRGKSPTCRQESLTFSSVSDPFLRSETAES